jgi:hypothetical protein
MWNHTYLYCTSSDDYGLHYHLLQNVIILLFQFKMKNIHFSFLPSESLSFRWVGLGIVSGTFDLAYAFLLAHDRFHCNNFILVTQDRVEINTSAFKSEIRDCR